MSQGDTGAAGDPIVGLLEAERYEEALGVSSGATRAEATAAFVRLSARYAADDRVRIALNKARGAMLSETDLQRGARLDGIGETEGAVSCFRRAVSQNGGLPAYRKLGQALSRLDREEEAIAYLEQAVQLGDEAVDYHWLGSSLVALGKYKAALPHLREAVLRRGWALDHDWLATALLRLGRQAESLPPLRRVVELRGEVDDYHRLGRTLAELGQRETALPHLEKAATERGSDVDCHWLGRTLSELGRKCEALPNLERAVSLRGDGEDYYWLGRTLAEMDQKEAAVDHLRRAADERGDASNYHWLGVTLADLGREGEAVPYLELAVEERGDPSDYQCLGIALLNLGQNEEARACFEEAVHLRGDADDHHWLGRVLPELGRREDALSHAGWSSESSSGVLCVGCGRPCEPPNRFCHDCSCRLPSDVSQIEGDAPDEKLVGSLDVAAEEHNALSTAVPVSTTQPERGCAPGQTVSPTAPLDVAAAENHEEVLSAVPQPTAQPESGSAPEQTISPTASLDVVTNDHGQGPITVAASTPQARDAPYATFVSRVLGSALLISVLFFNVAQALARSQWEGTVSTVVAIAAAVLLARSAWGTWRRIVIAEPEDDDRLMRRHRRVLTTSVVIVVCLFTSAALVGAAIGQSRAEAIQLAADMERMTTVGNRISKARSAVEATIASYVQMYKAIEPDVRELESTLRRLTTALGAYDAKFPAQHEQTSKSISDMETGLRRMALLKQQIEAAKQIDALDARQQFAAWQKRMLPLLADEHALEKAK